MGWVNCFIYTVTSCGYQCVIPLVHVYSLDPVGVIVIIRVVTSDCESFRGVMLTKSLTKGMDFRLANLSSGILSILL